MRRDEAEKKEQGLKCRGKEVYPVGMGLKKKKKKQDRRGQREAQVLMSKELDTLRAAV